MAKTNSAVHDTISGIHIIKSYNLIDVMFRKIFPGISGNTILTLLTPQLFVLEATCFPSGLCR